MSRAWSRATGALLLGALVAALAACARSGHAPASPDHATTATTVGVLERWESIDCGTGTFELVDGQVAEHPVRDCATGGFLRNMFGGSSSFADSKVPLAHGPLMLFGEDQLGPWFAAASDDRGDGSCYRASGGAFLEGDTLHFPSGLVVPVARPLQVFPRPEDHVFPLWSQDWMCLDRTGTVISVTWMPEL